VNNAHDSRWFDNCTEPYRDGGLETGCFTSSTAYVWQPRDEVKGDVARMIFYMATRYEGEMERLKSLLTLVSNLGTFTLNTTVIIQYHGIYAQFYNLGTGDMKPPYKLLQLQSLPVSRNL